VRQFDVGDFVYLQRQPNDTLDISFGCTILRIKVIRPSGVLELQGVDKRTIQGHPKNCVPCHLSNLDPTIITLIWIPPLDYPCRYVRGQMMLIRCCFVIIVMVIPSILPQVGAHSSSRQHLVLFIMLSSNTLFSTQTMPHFSRLKSKGGDT
jgi:hypothetical protein